ncbi:MAG TPA: UDP-N-acetylglucosamine--dolichyl-phosphate N-acetylglucosaminephosphotransferase [Candidatus Altiarchaeales archaeon]|nr:UDP-N-acetylglucosamine--dolichyl-phosphate N-acetylglucosaminephosphotransferase [Candidatus Altiarchaeales archaeon]
MIEPEYVFIPLVAMAFTLLATPWFIRRLSDAGLTVKDMNKASKPDVPEMGGLSIVAGFVVAVLFSIALGNGSFDMTLLLSGLSVVLIISIIGIIDDLIYVRQSTKALLPIFAALPLVAVKAGVTTMTFPVIGPVDFGILYPLLLIPIAITGAANACNMLAGFNGLEAGIGLIMCATIAFVSIIVGESEAFILSAAMAGALLAFLFFNWNPAKIFIGDSGTLSIGAVVASSVIIGDIERVGAILIIPFFLELFLKVRGKFRMPSFCGVEGGKLVCNKKSEVYGLGRLVMYLSGGITETRLVLTILGIEIVFAVIAVWSVV